MRLGQQKISSQFQRLGIHGVSFAIAVKMHKSDQDWLCLHKSPSWGHAQTFCGSRGSLLKGWWPTFQQLSCPKSGARYNIAGELFKNNVRTTSSLKKRVLKSPRKTTRLGLLVSICQGQQVSDIGKQIKALVGVSVGVCKKLGNLPGNSKKSPSYTTTNPASFAQGMRIAPGF